MKKGTKLKDDIEFSNVTRARYLQAMSGILSHEISQPLMVISAYIHGCIRRLEENNYDKNKIINIMQAVNRQVERAGMLVHRMHDRMPLFELTCEKTNIHLVIESAVSLLSSDIPYSYDTIHYEFIKEIPLVEIDKMQMTLVVLYLVTNAIEEMLDAKIAKPKLIIKTSQLNPYTIAIDIIDNGRGIPQALQNKLFNSFCSTKSKNVGMNLITCKNIIDAHQGKITFTSLPEVGSHFILTLPITQEH